MTGNNAGFNRILDGEQPDSTEQKGYERILEDGGEVTEGLETREDVIQRSRDVLERVANQKEDVERAKSQLNQVRRMLDDINQGDQELMVVSNSLAQALESNHNDTTQLQRAADDVYRQLDDVSYADGPAPNQPSSPNNPQQPTDDRRGFMKYLVGAGLGAGILGGGTLLGSVLTDSSDQQTNVNVGGSNQDPADSDYNGDPNSNGDTGSEDPVNEGGYELDDYLGQECDDLGPDEEGDILEYFDDNNVDPDDVDDVYETGNGGLRIEYDGDESIVINCN